jgi:hypothetical protein
VIAGADFVEARVQIRHDTGEDIQPAGGALRIGPGTQGLGELQVFQQRDEIDMAFLQNGPFRQIHLIHDEIRLIEVEHVEPRGNRGELRQKTADQAIGLAPQA